MSNNITKAICSYYNKLLCNSSNKISTTWKIVKTETGRTNTNEGITTISVNGNIVDNHHLILDSFNNNFLSIADTILKRIIVYGILIAIFPPSHIYQMRANNHSHIKFNNTSRHEIEEVIKSLKSSNSYGYDEVSIKIIKESSLFISSTLTKICNHSFSGIFLEYLKHSDIQSVYKNGDKHITK